VCLCVCVWGGEVTDNTLVDKFIYYEDKTTVSIIHTKGPSVVDSPKHFVTYISQTIDMRGMGWGHVRIVYYEFLFASHEVWRTLL
jgi:hypothetical protein